MTILVDSHAWIEFLKGTPAGAKVLELVKSEPRIFSSSLSLYEVHYRLAETRGEKTAEEAMQTILTASRTVGVNDEIAVLAAKLRKQLARRGAGAVDCLIYATAKKHGLKVLTGDPHFRGLDGIVFLE